MKHLHPLQMTFRDIEPEEIARLKRWTRDTMEAAKWINTNEKQMEAFKCLMIEWYGWPTFTLNINKLNNKVMKIMI